VLELLGVVQWPAYTPTSGVAMHPDRRALLTWESLAAGLDAHPPEVCLEALECTQAWPPGGLDLRRSLASRVVDAARCRERAGDPTGARALYERLGAVGQRGVAVRVARTLEAEGRGREALDALQRARREASAVERIAIGRAGRRVGRAVGRGWAPDPPLRRPRERVIALDAAGADGPRPLYQTPVGPRPVEAAIVERLASVGRVGLHGENALWTTLFALMFAEVYFLPVPGALPTRHLSGPLDVGTPLFAARRRGPVDAVLADVASGAGPARVLAADRAYRGCALAGAAWALASGETLAEIARALGPVALGQVLRRLVDEGWEAARGLPDLVLLPGRAVRLEGRPTRLGEDAMLVEIKGPGDTVRDEQAVWFDQLLGAHVPIELWRVVPRHALPEGC
jgi:hypothetical protein